MISLKTRAVLGAPSTDLQTCIHFYYPLHLCRVWKQPPRCAVISTIDTLLCSNVLQSKDSS